MAGIVMNVGPSAIGAAGASGGGQTLGAAQGTITINVHNVTQANNILQQSGRQIAQTFANVGRAAKAASQQQIAAAKASAASVASLASQTISSNKAIGSGAQLAATRTQAASKSIIASNNVLASSYKLSATQGTIASNAVIQSLRQQAQTARTSSTVQATAHRAVLQPIQQQVAANRLIISGLNVQAAQARATARTQQQAARQSVTAWQGFNQKLHEVRSEILLVSAGAALLAGAGIGYAATMQEARIQLEGMTGSLKAGDALMDNLQRQARKAGIPFKDILSFAVQLLPVLEGETKELDKWFDITRRTAVLNRTPTGGVAGATFSLREAFLSLQQGGRDFVSIADRFNISKRALSTAFESALGSTTEEKFLNAMDSILIKMGITSDAADKMALTFNASFAVARDSALRLLADGFTPLIMGMAPVLQTLADWMNMLRESNPLIVGFGAGILGIITIGTPLLLLINQLTIAWTAMGIAARTAIGRTAGVGGVAAGVLIGGALGAEVGMGVGGAIRTARGQDPLSREDVGQNVKNFWFERITEFAQGWDQFVKMLDGMTATLADIHASLHRILADILGTLAESTNIPGLKKIFKGLSASENAIAFDLENRAAKVREQGDKRSSEMWEGLARIARSWNISGFEDAAAGGRSSAGAGGFTTDQNKAITDWNRNVLDLQRKSNQDRIEAEKDYTRQIRDTVQKYNLSRAREEDDFNRNRAKNERDFNQSILDLAQDSARQRRRWEEDLARSIARLREDSADQIEDMEEDHARTLAEKRSDSAEREAELREDHDEATSKKQQDHNEKLADLEEDFLKEREKATKDSMEAQHQAASRFDAIALYREQRKFAEEEAEARQAQEDRLEEEKKGFRESIEELNDSYRERLEDEHKALAKSIRQQNEAHQRSLADERESLQKSIDQQNESHALQLERQKEDDDLRLADMQKSFDDQQAQQLAEYQLRRARQAEDHQSQLVQMAEQQQERLEKIDANYAIELERLNSAFDAQMAALGLYTDAYKLEEAAFFKDSLEAYRAYIKSVNDEFEKLRAGPAPLNPFITPGGWPSLGGDTTPSPGSSPGPGGGGDLTIATFNLLPGSVQVFPAAGQSPQDIGDEVVKRIGALLRQLIPGGHFN